jgi:hypothetical protein
LGELLNIILDENYDCADTTIPVSCQVLASTFYLELEDGNVKKRYLFELIMNNKIWQNITFWERSISQHIQCDIIEANEQDPIESAIDQPLHTIYKFNQDQEDRVIEVIYNKLSHIQYEMASFNIPHQQIKTLMNKYLKNSKLFPADKTQDIMMLLYQ